VIAYLDAAGVAAALGQEDAAYYWMLLKQDAAGSPWHLHALLVEAFPQPSNGRSFQPFVCVYDHLVTLAGQATGQTIGDWLTRGCGEVTMAEATEEASIYSFTMPPILSLGMPNIQPRQIASHLTYGATTAPWPYTQYEIPIEVRAIQRPEGPFVGVSGCQSFPNFHDLVSDLVYGVKRRPSGLMQLDGEAVTVRIAQTDAWIDRIVLSPRTLTVTVAGSDVGGARFEMKGSPDLWVATTLEQGIEQVDIDRQSVRLDYAMPEGPPSDLWMFLSRDGAWLDEHWPTAERSPLGPTSHNVTVVPPQVTSGTASRPVLYSPFSLTPRESEEHRREIDERAAMFAISDEQFVEYVRTFLARYRRTLDTFFPSIAPHIPLYAQYPFESLVLRLDDRGAIIGHRPGAAPEVRVLRPDDLDPPASTLNIFDIAASWGTPFVSFDLSARRYDAEAAESEALRQALDDALAIFWRILDAPTFHALCLALLRLEGVELDHEVGVATDDGADATGTVYLREPGGFRRAERWAFQFKHAASDDRVSVNAIRRLETALDGDGIGPTVMCLMTSGDVTSIGKHVALGDDRIRVWDRPVLDLLTHRHLEAIAPFFPQYAEAVGRVEALDEAPGPAEAAIPSRLAYFKDGLRDCPTGRKHFARYETIGTEMWDYLFAPALQLTRRQSPTRDKVQRRDVLFKNRRSTPFWRRIGDKLDADFVIVDFKNYKEPVAGGVIAEVAKYANEAVGRFVAVVSRLGVDDGVPDAQIRTFRDDRTIVVVVSDAQMLEMVGRKERGEPPEDVLEDLVDVLLINY